MINIKDSLLEETKKILRDNGIWLNRKLSQSFIIDPRYVWKHLVSAQLTKNDIVLEIGSGIGTLTEKVAPLVKRLYSIEIDERFIGILKNRLINHSNVEIIHGDALNVDLPFFNKIVANIPYAISSPLTFKLLTCNFELGIMMYQFEFAKRLTAKPGSEYYGRLSVNVNLRSEITLLEKVPRTAFFPKPRVDSALVKIIPKKNMVVKSSFQDFTKVVDGLFPYRNKKVRSAAKHFLYNTGVEKNFIKTLLEAIPFRDVRVKDLDINMIEEIAQYLLRKGGSEH